MRTPVEDRPAAGRRPDRMGGDRRRHPLHGADPDPRGRLDRDRRHRARRPTHLRQPQAHARGGRRHARRRHPGAGLPDRPGRLPGHERRLPPLLRQALPQPRHGDRRRPDGAGRGDRDRRLRASAQAQPDGGAMRVVVLGAGVIGVDDRLLPGARPAHEVVVVDRRPGSALETSFANGALLTPSTSDSWAAPGTPRARS